ncbi:MAG TPA: capsule assembly Wzi family protein [Candidatus Acidoferrales bacterium]|nr:capsule assembly Wzi family protein [Candidatus Acidoferrales bacterium]
MSADSDPNARYYDNTLGPHLLKDVAGDQKRIWTSFKHVRLIDADWLVPLGAATGIMLATDTDVSKHFSSSPSRIKYSNDLGNFGIGSLVAIGGGMYLWGHFTHEDHKRETGLLAGEAAINSLAVTYAIKYSLGRQRPLQGTPPYQGDFWQGGVSFPSEHSAAAWSIASVIAHEYPGPFTSILSYGLASAISASRISAKEHFPSDVLIGSAIGWLVGEEVYRHHHDPAVGGGDWETYAETHDRGPNRPSTSVGSPYVELDSWIYPAIERLAALGYIHSEYLDMRPWTRIECAHLVEEAGDEIRAGVGIPDQVEELYSTLEREFQRDLDALDGGSSRRFIRLESLYTDVTGIDGPPLNDSYHFGQTIINNYGRPYQEGLNTYDGFSGYGTAGRFTIYVRGEYQYAPSAAAYPLSVRNAIATADQNPLQPAIPITATNRFTLLDTYVAANADGWDLAFGKQSLWWGPGDGGALLFSDNAEPIYMFRASRITAVSVPLLSRLLGPMKLDAFFGKLSGNEFPASPLIHGEKIGFKPTQNLELSFSRTSELGGVGRPLTAGAVWNSYVSFKSSVNYSAARNPGKRAGGFSFSYKVPFVRNWLTVYTDSYTPDDPSPLDAPRRAIGNPGLYVSRIPGVPKLDLRFEAVYTNTPARDNPPLPGGLYAYWDLFYHDYYTNDKNIIGSWIGRDGQGFQAWSTYHFSSRNNLQFGYRHAKVDSSFIPNGETINDGSAKIDWWIHDEVSLSASVQYEKWLAPILAPGPQTNWTSSVGVTFYPRSWTW